MINFEVFPQMFNITVLFALVRIKLYTTDTFGAMTYKKIHSIREGFLHLL